MPRPSMKPSQIETLYEWSKDETIYRSLSLEVDLGYQKHGKFQAVQVKPYPQPPQREGQHHSLPRQAAQQCRSFIMLPNLEFGEPSSYDRRMTREAMKRIY